MFAMAIIPPVENAVLVDPMTVAVRYAIKGMTAALVQAIMNTPTYLPPTPETVARRIYPIATKINAPMICYPNQLRILVV